MSVEPIGAVTALVGVLFLVFGTRLAIYSLFLTSLLGAAAAAILTALGGANVPPAHLLLGFAAADLALRPRYLAFAVHSLKYPHAGFWLLTTVIYALLTAAFMPRLFANLTNVFAIARTENGATLALLPLAPVSGNLTQSIYLIGDLVAFVIFFSYASDRNNLEVIVRAVIVCAMANIFFGIVDLVTYQTNTTELLSFIRNGTYAMLYEVELAGTKRVVGTFAEAASYGSVTLWLFAFTGTLWLQRIYPRSSGTAALLSVGALMASTSTTAYAGFAVIVALAYIWSVVRLFAGRANRAASVFVMVGPFLVAVLTLGLALHPPAWAVLEDVFRAAFVEKLASQSGVERSSWNRQALLNVIETAGLGVGVGSTRASSWLLAVPVSIGIVGTLTYFGFILRILLIRRTPDPFVNGVQSAARAACVAHLITNSIGGAFVDLGLPFFMCAGIALGPAGRAGSHAPVAQVTSRRSHGGMALGSIQGSRT